MQFQISYYFIFFVKFIFLYNIQTLVNIHSYSFLFQYILYFCGMFGITGGYHRLFTHKSYDAHPLFRYLLILFGTSTLEGSVIDWCSTHRMHHIYDGNDIDLNPYPIEKGLFHAHFFWIKGDYLTKKYNELLNNTIKKMSNNEWKNDIHIINHQHKYYYIYGPSFTIIFPILFEYYLLNSPFNYSITITLLRTIIVWHSTWAINSLAHYVGNKPYDKEISAINNHMCSIIAFGEGYHNYHHRFPKDYKASINLYCFNITAHILTFLAQFNIVYNRKYILKKDVYDKSKTEYNILK